MATCHVTEAEQESIYSQQQYGINILFKKLSAAASPLQVHANRATVILVLLFVNFRAGSTLSTLTHSKNQARIMQIFAPFFAPQCCAFTEPLQLYPCPHSSPRQIRLSSTSCSHSKSAWPPIQYQHSNLNSQIAEAPTLKEGKTKLAS